MAQRMRNITHTPSFMSSALHPWHYPCVPCGPCIEFINKLCWHLLPHLPVQPKKQATSQATPLNPLAGRFGSTCFANAINSRCLWGASREDYGVLKTNSGSSSSSRCRKS